MGPFDEAEIENLMLNAVISEEDDISYDGFSWSSSDGSLQPKTESKSSPRYGLSLDDEEGEAFDSISFDQDRGFLRQVFSKMPPMSLKILRSQASRTKSESGSYYSDDFFTKTGHQKNQRKREKVTAQSFYAVLSFSTMIVLAR